MDSIVNHENLNSLDADLRDIFVPFSEKVTCEIGYGFPAARIVAAAPIFQQRGVREKDAIALFSSGIIGIAALK